MNFKHLFLLLCLVICLLLAGQSSTSHPAHAAAPPVPDGLAAADWATIQSFLPSDYLKASNTGANDNFSDTVAVDGDTVVVGAYREGSNATGVNGDQTNNSALDSGAVYVFTRTSGVWNQQAYLKASNTEASDQFGTDVAVDGDTIVVGAVGEDSNATGVNGNQADNSASTSGAAYVFTRTGGVWSQQAYLKASNTGAGGDQFGVAVAVEGDTVVVGANLEDSNATGVNGDQANNSAANSGAAYVFTRTGGVWSQQAYLKASNTGADDRFGYDVAVDGDTMVVGANLEDSNATGVNGGQANNSASASGAAYVFTRTGGVWSQQAYLKASNTGADDYFGWAVAVDGDTIVVGAYQEDSSATGVNGDQVNNLAAQSGAVYVFTRTGGVWSQQAYLKASNTGAGDQFGRAIAVDGDTIVARAYQEDSSATGVNGDQTNNSASNSGAAYVFTRTGGVWSQQAYLKASNTEASDQFSSAVAVDGDTIVVGAVGEDSNATGVNGNQANNSAPDSGAAYIFHRCGVSVQSGVWNDTATWGGTTPPIDADVCIDRGHTVTMTGDATVHQVGVHPTGVLDLGNNTLFVEERVFNSGTLRQRRAVNSASVEILHIQSTTNDTKYRGVAVDAIANSQTLGDTTVSVRELNFGEYCTNTGATSPAYARRCFDITPTTPLTNSVLVRLYGRTADELNGIAPASLVVYRNTPAGSGTWVPATGGAVGTSGDYSYAQGQVAGFSAFLLGGASVPTAVSTLHTQTNTPSPTPLIPLLATVLTLLTSAWLWLTRSSTF